MLPQAFVMMPFAEEFTIVRDSIKKVAFEAGFECAWSDEMPLVGKITEQIESEIRQSQICICDVTNKNPNVAWEYGYATALRKKVVLLSQNRDSIYFDIQDNRTIIYNVNSIEETLTKPLSLSLKTLKTNLSYNIPELLTGTRNHDNLRIAASGKNITETQYELFKLIALARSRVFLAGQNIYYLVQSNFNKRKFTEEIQKFLKRNPEGLVDIMLCDEKCSHAILTWEYSQKMNNFREQLIEVTTFLKEVLATVDADSSMNGRLTVKKFDFVPLSATIIDADSNNGIAVITPSIFQSINSAKPCFIVSCAYNKDIFHSYWSVYHSWYTSMPHSKL